MSVKKNKYHKRRNNVRVFSSIGAEMTPTTAARARKLLKAGVARPFETWEEDLRFAIKLTTETRQEAFRIVQAENDKTKNESIAVCWGCGTIVPFEDKSKRHWCPDCLEKYETERDVDLKAHLKIKDRMMLDRALYMLELQRFKVDVLDYKEASEVVRERFISQPGCFDSSHEMVAAMELLRQRVRAKMQYLVGKHRVDFFLPDEKIVLEVDGFLHQYRKVEDKQIDKETRETLGHEWEVVRIPTEYIETNVQGLLPAIKEIRKQTQQARADGKEALSSIKLLKDKKFWKALNEERLSNDAGLIKPSFIEALMDIM